MNTDITTWSLEAYLFFSTTVSLAIFLISRMRKLAEYRKGYCSLYCWFNCKQTLQIKFLYNLRNNNIHKK